MKSAPSVRRYFLRIWWPDVRCSDYFEEGFFSERSEGAAIAHRVGKNDEAQCVLTRRGRTVLLDYGHAKVRRFNKAKGNELGTMRVTFYDRACTHVKGVAWKQEGRNTFSTGEQVVQWFPCEVRDPGVYRYTLRRGERRLKLEAIRKAQGRLKSQLLSAYRGACCISGCTVRQALDAAHLDAAGYESREHPRNAILLRADLHRLFDVNMLGIDPATRKVRVGTEAMKDKIFASLDGREVCLPSGDWVRYAPDPAALQRKWRRFQKTLAD